MAYGQCIHILGQKKKYQTINLILIERKVLIKGAVR